VAGSSIIMWLAEKINEHGIGNGISMILFANILSSIFGWLQSMWSMTFTSVGFDWVGCVISVGMIILAIGVMVAIVWFTESERRIPVQYAKRQVGRKMYGGQSSNLPLKMNMAGVMPVIFASSIVSIPMTIASFCSADSWFYKFAYNWFSPSTVAYLIVNVVLIFLFSYFYIMISFNPVEVANNIKNQGGSVPGIRPGKPTSDYIKKILNRITTLGAVFLALVAGLPMLINIINTLLPNTVQLPGIAFAGTSMLIVVGVALETFRSLESQLAMRNYKGFLD
jgi:preprotein translocase subunit SecY